MDFAAFELDRKFVIEALRRGENALSTLAPLDYLEPVSEAAEADFPPAEFYHDSLGKPQSPRPALSPYPIGWAEGDWKRQGAATHCTHRRVTECHPVGDL